MAPTSIFLSPNAQVMRPATFGAGQPSYLKPTASSRAKTPTKHAGTPSKKPQQTPEPPVLPPPAPDPEVTATPTRLPLQPVTSPINSPNKRPSGTGTEKVHFSLASPSSESKKAATAAQQVLADSLQVGLARLDSRGESPPKEPTVAPAPAPTEAAAAAPAPHAVPQQHAAAVRVETCSIDDYEAARARKRQRAPSTAEPPRASAAAAAAAEDDDVLGLGDVEGTLSPPPQAAHAKVPPSPETPQWLRTAEVALKNTPLPARALRSVHEPNDDFDVDDDDRSLAGALELAAEAHSAAVAAAKDGEEPLPAAAVSACAPVLFDVAASSPPPSAQPNAVSSSPVRASSSPPPKPVAALPRATVLLAVGVICAAALLGPSALLFTTHPSAPPAHGHPPAVGSPDAARPLRMPLSATPAATSGLPMLASPPPPPVTTTTASSMMSTSSTVSTIEALVSAAPLSRPDTLVGATTIRLAAASSSRVLLPAPEPLPRAWLAPFASHLFMAAPPPLLPAPFSSRQASSSSSSLSKPPPLRMLPPLLAPPREDQEPPVASAPQPAAAAPPAAVVAAAMATDEDDEQQPPPAAEDEQQQQQQQQQLVVELPADDDKVVEEATGDATGEATGDAPSVALWPFALSALALGLACMAHFQGDTLLTSLRAHLAATPSSAAEDADAAAAEAPAALASPRVANSARKGGKRAPASKAKSTPAAPVEPSQTQYGSEAVYRISSDPHGEAGKVVITPVRRSKRAMHADSAAQQAAKQVTLMSPSNPLRGGIHFEAAPGVRVEAGM